MALRGPYQPVGHNRAYGADRKKREARDFIAKCWREFSGESSISGQYWTLCGPLTMHGHLQENSELRQLQAAGLFQPQQFVGVERIEAVHRANERALSKAYPIVQRPTLHHGEIIEVLNRELALKRLRPSVVHLDSINRLDVASQLLWRTLNVLNHVDGPTMVVWNLISGQRVPQNVIYPWDRRDTDTLRGRIAGYVGEHLLNDPVFRSVYRHGWNMFPDTAEAFTSCRYESSGATQMTMYVFTRRRKACRGMCAC